MPLYLAPIFSPPDTGGQAVGELDPEGLTVRTLTGGYRVLAWRHTRPVGALLTTRDEAEPRPGWHRVGLDQLGEAEPGKIGVYLGPPGAAPSDPWRTSDYSVVEGPAEPGWREPRLSPEWAPVVAVEVLPPVQIEAPPETPRPRNARGRFARKTP